MNTKTRDIILYDNYPCREREQYTKENILINNPELYNAIEDIPQKRYCECSLSPRHERMVHYKMEFELLFKQDKYLLTGYFGSWKGRLAVANLFVILKTYKVFSHLDYLCIIDKNSHLVIEDSYHDGSDCYN